MKTRLKTSVKPLHILFYVKAVWSKCIQSTLGIILSLIRVGRVDLLNKRYRDVIKKTTNLLLQKIFPQVFLHSWYVMHMYHIFTGVRSVTI